MSGGGLVAYTVRMRKLRLALVAVALVVVSCGPPPAPPAGGGAPPGPGVLGLGDSVMLGASAALQAAVPGMEVDAAVSRQFHEAPGIVYWRAQAGSLPGRVIVHLGTNGTVTAAACDSLLANLGARRVIIVNLTVPRSWEAANNDTLAQCAARHGATLVDWHSISAGRADLLAPDGYHLQPAGAREYAAAIARAL